MAEDSCKFDRRQRLLLVYKTDKVLPSAKVPSPSHALHVHDLLVRVAENVFQWVIDYLPNIHSHQPFSMFYSPISPFFTRIRRPFTIPYQHPRSYFVVIPRAGGCAFHFYR